MVAWHPTSLIGSELAAEAAGLAGWQFVEVAVLDLHCLSPCLLHSDPQFHE